MSGIPASRCRGRAAFRGASFAAAVRSAALLLLFASLLRFPSLAASAARDGMDFAARRLIPALFPAMALSSLLLRCRVRLPFAGALARLLRLPPRAAGALLLGWTAGFPAGAAAAAELYRDGTLSARDAERLGAAASAPGPAFFVVFVGGLWDSAPFGWFLLILHALTMLLLCRAFFRSSSPPARAAVARSPAQETVSFFPALSRAAADAGSACVAVAASAVFFRVLSAVLGRLFPPLSPLFLLTFEISSAAAFGAARGGLGGALAVGFAVGFSGLSVLAQLARPLADAGLSLRPALAARLACGAALSLGAAVFFLLRPLSPASDAAFFNRDAGFLPAAAMLAASLLSKILFPEGKFFRRT